jgi:hypothetical protein
MIGFCESMLPLADIMMSVLKVHAQMIVVMINTKHVYKITVVKGFEGFSIIASISGRKS